jgi:hypothetical protein
MQGLPLAVPKSQTRRASVMREGLLSPDDDKPLRCAETLLRGKSICHVDFIRRGERNAREHQLADRGTNLVCKPFRGWRRWKVLDAG